MILLIAICILFPKLPPALCSVDTFSRLFYRNPNVKSVFKTIDKRINQMFEHFIEMLPCVRDLWKALILQFPIQQMASPEV
jgi:hypothetical protein